MNPWFNVQHGTAQIISSPIVQTVDVQQEKFIIMNVSSRTGSLIIPEIFEILFNRERDFIISQFRSFFTVCI